jgi:MFS transporter, FHS family, L-fucose permease
MDVALSSKKPPLSPAGNYKNHGALAIVTALFFMWGFCTVLNDVLIPHLQLIFELSYLKASLIQLAFFGSYFLFAVPAGRLVETLGYQRTMVLGLSSMAIGALLFLPAAATAKYSLFLAAQVILAAGVTVLQVAANPYVTILGEPETASIRLNLTQAFNTLGDTIAPYVGSVLLLGGVESQSSSITGPALTAFRIREIDNVKIPYLSIAIALFILAGAVALYRFPHLDVTQDFHSVGFDMDRVSLWKHSHLWLGALAIFIYVGAEVSIGSFLAKYIADPTIGNLTLQKAAKMVTVYWAGMMLGRFAGSAAMRRIAPNQLLALAGIGAACMALLSLLTLGRAAMVTILAVGVFNSIMFPTIFTLSIAGLGRLTGRGSGLLVQAIVGGAVFPVIMGHLADRFGIHRALILPFLCYLYIIYYGLRGYRIATV